MFGPKAKSLTQLDHYLGARKPYRPPTFRRGEYLATALVGGAGAGFLTLIHAPVELSAIGAVVAAGFGVGAALAKPARRRSSVDEVFERAEAVAETLRQYSSRRRLHLVLHPGIATILNECAGFWQRIQMASDRKLWEDAGVEPHWLNARADWEAAADLAMAQALLLTDSSINRAPARPRVEEVVGDLLDTYVFNRPNQSSEPLPPAFEPLREIAEKLQALTVEVEGATRRLSDTTREAPTADAVKRLDEVLTELRSIHEAETELRQDLRG